MKNLDNFIKIAKGAAYSGVAFASIFLALKYSPNEPRTNNYQPQPAYSQPSEKLEQVVKQPMVQPTQSKPSVLEEVVKQPIESKGQLDVLANSTQYEPIPGSQPSNTNIPPQPEYKPITEPQAQVNTNIPSTNPQKEMSYQEFIEWQSAQLAKEKPYVPTQEELEQERKYEKAFDNSKLEKVIDMDGEKFYRQGKSNKYKSKSGKTLIAN